MGAASLSWHHSPRHKSSMLLRPRTGLGFSTGLRVTCLTKEAKRKTEVQGSVSIIPIIGINMTIKIPYYISAS